LFSTYLIPYVKHFCIKTDENHTLKQVRSEKQEPRSKEGDLEELIIDKEK
jgi:hypothetical protein